MNNINYKNEYNRTDIQNDINFCDILGEIEPDKLFIDKIKEVTNVEIIKNARNRFEIVTVNSRKKIYPIKGLPSFSTINNVYRFILHHISILNLIKPYEEHEIESHALF